jgi:hypothetical protein
MGIKRCVELKEYDTNQNNEKYSKMLTIIGIVLIIILFSKVVNKPYFVLKMTRLVYAQNLSKWENSLKWYLPLFIPVAVRCGKDGHKLLKNSFIIFLTIYYFWVGDKFGTYFFAVYIILICNIEDSSKKTIGKLAIVMLIAVFALLGVVYIQNILLYNSTFSAYLDMVFARLSNQGGVWWGTYIRYKNCTPKIGEFIEELKSILPLSNINTYSVGQWKMMLVSSGFSAYAQYRIDIVNPYTATTTASCFYYFGMIITLVLYVIIGVIYGRYIHYMREICSSGNLIESMIAVKILIHLHAMLTGSNLYLISYKGLLYVLLALFFAKCRKMNKHIVIGRFYIA